MVLTLITHSFMKIFIYRISHVSPFNDFSGFVDKISLLEFESSGSRFLLTSEGFRRDIEKVCSLRRREKRPIIFCIDSFLGEYEIKDPGPNGVTYTFYRNSKETKDFMTHTSFAFADSEEMENYHNKDYDWLDAYYTFIFNNKESIFRQR